MAADAIIMQFAGWWMGQPWQLKRWEDLVFTRPEIASGDGRSRTDRTAIYGTGGRNTQKTYMLSSTWNAPLEAFNEPMQFFEAKGIDGLLFPMHKTFQFIGMRPLPSFIAQEPDHRGRPRALQGAPHPLLRMILRALMRPS